MLPINPTNELPLTVYGGAGYIDLPAIKIDDGHGRIITRWQLSDEDRARIAAGGDIFLDVWTFGRPLQPVCLSTEPPVIEVIHADGIRAVTL